MFVRTSSLLLPIVALAAVTTAAPGALEARMDLSSCNTGPISCCNNTYSMNSDSLPLTASLLPSLKTARSPCSPDGLTSIDDLVGLGCTLIVGSAASCTQQPVCCTGNTFNGLINLGCSPINMVL
ncbi:hydrophobin [Melanogaster broomeanus]|nr:hydrophobin [Melanogaster broomeanus]